MKQTTEKTCRLCKIEQTIERYIDNNDIYLIDCPACGRIALAEYSSERFESWWTPVRRSALVHEVRHRRGLRRYGETKYALITGEDIQRVKDAGANLPSKLEQADNVIRYLGDLESELGSVPFEKLRGLWAYAGSASETALCQTVSELRDARLIADDLRIAPASVGESLLLARLSLKGFERWEKLREGDTSSRDGFVAMQFGDERLDSFIRDYVIGEVAAALGVIIHRMDSPGLQRSGLIDNNMREAIESAAFVIVEVSHGNRGAYWEAGLAEGLRKPVIYICEQCVWDDPNTRPHFDVNHRTTIMWNETKPKDFVETLTNTIRNSLRHRTNQGN